MERQYKDGQGFMNSHKRNALAVWALFNQLEREQEFYASMSVSDYNEADLLNEQLEYNAICYAINSFRKLRGCEGFREAKPLTIKQFKELFRKKEVLE